MPAIIFKGRYYHLFNPNDYDVERFIVRKVKCSRGLLMMTSLDNFKQIEEYENILCTRNQTNHLVQPNPVSGGRVPFFIFNGVTNKLEIYKDSVEPVTIPRESIPDIGPISLFNNFADGFNKLCLAKEDLGIKAVYKHHAKQVGPYIDKFLENSEGIDLDTLFDHPYAREVKKVEPFLRPPQGYIGNGFSQSPSSFPNGGSRFMSTEPSPLTYIQP